MPTRKETIMQVRLTLPQMVNCFVRLSLKSYSSPIKAKNVVMVKLNTFIKNIRCSLQFRKKPESPYSIRVPRNTTAYKANYKADRMLVSKESAFAEEKPGDSPP